MLISSPTLLKTRQKVRKQQLFKQNLFPSSLENSPHKKLSPVRHAAAAAAASPSEQLWLLPSDAARLSLSDLLAEAVARCGGVT